MIASSVTANQITPGLGWPHPPRGSSQLGWPRDLGAPEVPRETHEVPTAFRSGDPAEVALVEVRGQTIAANLNEDRSVSGRRGEVRTVPLDTPAAAGRDKTAIDHVPSTEQAEDFAEDLSGDQTRLVEASPQDGVWSAEALSAQSAGKVAQVQTLEQGAEVEGKSSDVSPLSPVDRDTQPERSHEAGLSINAAPDETADRLRDRDECAIVTGGDTEASNDLLKPPTPVGAVDADADPLAPEGIQPAADSPRVLPPQPGPRRAKFDEDEFALPPVIEEPRTPPVSRGTHAVLLPAPAKTRVMVVANQKGGVGKTTTSVNLAAALALGGLKVLVIDLDPQGNASTALGIDHGPGTPGTYDVLIGGDTIAEHVVDSPEAPQLKVLPATIDLAGAEIELVSVVARENRLLKAIRAYLKDHQVDYIFLDCPPSLGLLTLNALVAAGEILIPIQCEYYALEGVSQLMRTINLVKGELNDELELSTVLLTMFDARTRLAAQVVDEVRLHFAAQTLPTVIPRSVRISEAPSYGQTVLTYHPDSAGAVSYREAAHEIARRGAKENA